MRERSNETLVFDFDGTLIDSAPAILDSFGAALREAGVVPQVPLEPSLIGPPLMETLARLAGSDEKGLIQALTEGFKRHYDVAGVAATKGYVGIDRMLDALAEAGVTMHICTNKRLAVTRAILENLGWQDRFVSVYALDMTEPRLSGKTQLLSKQIVELGLATGRTRYIGDKMEDGQAADANGLVFHYAAWGYGDLQPETLPAGWLWLDRPEDLEGFLASEQGAVQQ